MPSLYREEDVFACLRDGRASRTRTGTGQFRKLVLCPIELRPQKDGAPYGNRTHVTGMKTRRPYR